MRVLFERELLEETPKQGDPAFEQSRYTTVLSNATAIKAAVESAETDGFAAEVDNRCDDWDYPAGRPIICWGDYVSCDRARRVPALSRAERSR